MDTESRHPKGRDGTLSSLNVVVEALNLAKEASSITPAKAVFGSVSILLAMIRVRFLPPGAEMFQVDTYSGLDGQPAGLCRARAILCRHLYSPRPRDGREAIGGAQSVGVRCDKPIDDVSLTGDTRFEPPPTMLSIAGLLQKYKERSSNGAGGTQSLDSFTRRMMGWRSLHGSWTSTGSFMSSTCVHRTPA